MNMKREETDEGEREAEEQKRKTIAIEQIIKERLFEENKQLM